MLHSKLEQVLELYSLEEIFNHNDLTEEEVLSFLVEEEFLTLPEPQQVDFD